MLLVTTAVDPRYQLSVVLSEIKENVWETAANGDQKVQPPLGSSTLQISAAKESETTIRFFDSFETEEKTAQKSNEQQNLKNDELVAEVKGFLAIWNLSTQAKEAEALCCWNSNESKYPHHASSVSRYHR